MMPNLKQDEDSNPPKYTPLETHLAKNDVVPGANSLEDHQTEASSRKVSGVCLCLLTA